MPQADSTGIIDKQSPEACDKTTQDLAVLHEELSSLPDLPEVEWTRLRALEFQDLLRQRGVLRDRLVKMGCQLCPEFEEHVSGAKRSDFLHSHGPVPVSAGLGELG